MRRRNACMFSSPVCRVQRQLVERLCQAAVCGTAEEVGGAIAALERAGGSVDQPMDMCYGMHALYVAAASANRGAVAALLAADANVWARTTEPCADESLFIGGRTALHGAADAGATDIAQLLLDAGADVNAADLDGGRPLHFAARSGGKASVELLVAAGAEVGAVDEGGGTPLLAAAWLGNVEVVRVLLAAGAAVDHYMDGFTPLMAAAREGHLAVLHALLDAGASLEAFDQAGYTALTHAATHARNACGTALLAAGAVIDGSGWGPTPLAEAAAAYHHPALVVRLLAAGGTFGRHTIYGLQRTLLAVWEGAPARLPDLAQHMEPGVLARVRTALAALRLRTPLRQPELYMRVVGLALQ